MYESRIHTFLLKIKNIKKIRTNMKKILLFIFFVLVFISTISCSDKTLKDEETQLLTDANGAKINIFLYFYEDKYGLAYKNSKYGFIDIQDNLEIDYKYTQARVFDQNMGYARVKKGSEYYLIDTTGTEFLFAEEINNLNENTKALDLSIGLTKNLEEVFNYTQIEIISLNGKYLDTLSHKIINLTNLKYLNLGSNRLSTLPSEIRQFSKLTGLDLSLNKLNPLSSEIGQFKQLTHLDLSRNELNTLPSEIGQLKQLKYLGLAKNKLSTLPSEIGQLKQLTNLDLAYNKLSTLPSEIGQFKQLTNLDLRGNPNLNAENIKNIFAFFPKEIIYSTQKYIHNNKKLLINIDFLNLLKLDKERTIGLTELELYHSNLSTLPSEIGQLKQLIRLNLGYNNLSTLPSEIGQLTQLTDLNLGSNQFIALRSEIGQLKKLMDLGLGKNELSAFPLEILQLKQLMFLDLSFNKLNALPSEIEQLQQLTSLSLAYNKLTTLPESIKNLTKLRVLYLLGNYFSEEEKEKIEKWLPNCRIQW